MADKKTSFTITYPSGGGYILSVTQEGGAEVTIARTTWEEVIDILTADLRSAGHADQRSAEPAFKLPKVFDAYASQG